MKSGGQYIFCEQVVRVNQEQFHFGYIKLYTLFVILQISLLVFLYLCLQFGSVENLDVFCKSEIEACYAGNVVNAGIVVPLVVVTAEPLSF